MDVVFFAFLVAATLVVATNSKLRTWAIGKSGLGGSNPLILISVGLVVFNLVVWAMISWLWEILTYTNHTLALFNIGFGVVLYLLTVKAKDKDGKETDKADPTASKLAMVIGFLLVLGLGTIAVLNWQRGDLEPEEHAEKQETEKALRKAWQAIPIDAQVLTAVARCQPKEFNTPEKVEKAIELYAQKGLLPWHSSMNCWESMITQDMFPVKFAVVEAPTESWSQPVKSPRIRNGGAFVDWSSAPDGCMAMANGRGEEVPCKEARFGILYSTQFRSVGEEPVRVEVMLTRKN